MHAPRFLVAVALCLVGLAASAARAERMDAMVPLGAPASGTVAVDQTVSIGFLVTQGAGRSLVFSVKRSSKTSKLVPDVKLFDPDGLPFDIVVQGHGTVSKAGAVAWTAKLKDVPKTGLWRLAVAGANHTDGGFTALVKGKDVLKTSSNKASPPTIPVGGRNDVAIVAGENVALTVTATRVKGSSINLQLSILDANDSPLEDVNAVVNAKSGALTLKAFRLPFFGKYKLRFSGGTSGGGFNYVVSTAAAKIKGAVPVAVPLNPDAEFSAFAADAEPGIARAFDGSHSTPLPGGTPKYRWVQVGGPAVTMTNTTTSQPGIVPPDSDASLAFQLSVSSNGVLSKPATFGVEVGKRPLADAGRSQSVAGAAAVALDGGASRARSTRPLKYEWRQMPNETTVALTGADTATPTFTAPTASATALHFGLIVDDGRIRSDEDVVLVFVGDASKHLADAGRNQSVPRMASVSLSGLASHTASGVLDGPMLWTQTSGPTVTLAGAATPSPSFTAPKANADLRFSLKVNNETGTTDSVWVHVRSDETNLPAPARGSGPITVGSGSAPLAAAATDPDNDAVTYRWAQLSGPAAAPATATSASTTTSIPTGSNALLFACIANDGLQYGAPDFVAVRNTGYTGGPIALAGADRSADAGAAVALDGAGVRTDGGGAPVTFQWTQITGKDWYDFFPSGPNTAAKPSVALPTDVSSLTSTRTVVFQLVVNDGVNSSLPDLAAVTYGKLPANGRPVVTAQASITNPLPGQTVTLNGTANDRDNDPMTYQWSQVPGGGSAVALTNATSLNATFVAPDSGTLTFQLVANDGFEDSLPGVTPTPVTVDRKPTASVVVSPSSGPPGTLVTMDGQASADPEGSTLTYQWTQISGVTVNGINATASVITFNAPAGPVSFRLVVNDGRQPSDPRTGGFSANLPPAVAPTASRNASIGVSGPAAAITAAYGATVSLNANGTGGGGSLSYTWRVVSSSLPGSVTINLSSLTSATPTFVAPSPSSSSGPFGYANPAPASPGAVPTGASLGPRAVFGVTATDGSQSSQEGQVTVYFYASLSDLQQTSGTIMAVMQGGCTTCHSQAGNCPISSSGQNLNLNGVTPFLAQRGAAACTTGSTRLPNQGTVGQSGTTSLSYLFFRISAATGQSHMGWSGPGSSLTQDRINLVQDWIDQGVQNN